MDTKIIRKYRDAESLPAVNRHMGATEAIYYLLDTLYCLNFVVFAEVSGTLEPSGLDPALQAAQQEKPLLRARIARVDGHPVFEAVPMKQAPLQARVLPLRHWRQRLVAQLDTPFADAAPLARFFWFGGRSGRSVAAMVFHHAIADGKSGAQVLLDVLRRAGGEDLPLALRAARPSAQDLDPINHKGMVESTVQRLGFWLEQGRATLKFPLQLPGYDPQLRPQRSIQAIAYTLSPEKGQALLAACRAHGTTVHGVLGAAQILAINRECGAPEERHLALTSLADLRGVLRDQLSAHDLGLYIATLTTVHAVAAQPDLWQLARNIRSQLSQSLHRGDANLIHTFYPRAPLLPVSRHSARLVQAGAAMGSPASVLTNIGHQPPVMLGNGARIRSLAFMVSPPPQCPICVTVAGYAGGMHLHLLYDQTKLDDAQAQRIGKALMDSLAAAIDTSPTSKQA